MKLSEAIRLGSMLRPQVKWERHNAIGSCALGAAEDAVGYDGRSLQVAERHWPILYSERVSPVTGEMWPMGSVIASLNNGTDYAFRLFPPWTRERIADWVESIESFQSANAVQSQPVEAAEESAELAAV